MVPLAPGSSAPVNVQVTDPIGPGGGAGVQLTSCCGSAPQIADAGTNVVKLGVASAITSCVIGAAPSFRYVMV